MCWLISLACAGPTRRLRRSFDARWLAAGAGGRKRPCGGGGGVRRGHGRLAFDYSRGLRADLASRTCFETAVATTARAWPVTPRGQPRA